jgi:putative acetyltransferase
MAMDVVISAEDPRADDVRPLLDAHLTFAAATTPPGHVFALGLDGLLDPSVTFFTACRNGEVLGIGALKELGDGHAELKSMHTISVARGQGVGRAMVEHLVAQARERGSTRVSLETGTMAEFAPAHALYERQGFVPCLPFGGYPADPVSVCLTLDLDPTDHIRLRRADLRDASAVAEVWLRARKANIPAVPPSIHDDDDVRGWFAEVVLPTLETWVADDAGTIVAVLVLEPGWVDQLHVDPDRQGQGIGARLLEVAKALNPAGLDLWTFQTNVRAQRFYRRHGFVEVARTDGDNEEGLPDVRLHWAAASSLRA